MNTKYDKIQKLADEVYKTSRKYAKTRNCTKVDCIAWSKEKINADADYKFQNRTLEQIKEFALWYNN